MAHLKGDLVPFSTIEELIFQNQILTIEPNIAQPFTDDKLLYIVVDLQGTIFHTLAYPDEIPALPSIPHKVLTTILPSTQFTPISNTRALDPLTTLAPPDIPIRPPMKVNHDYHPKTHYESKIDHDPPTSSIKMPLLPTLSPSTPRYPSIQMPPLPPKAPTSSKSPYIPPTPRVAPTSRVAPTPRTLAKRSIIPTTPSYKTLPYHTPRSVSPSKIKAPAITSSQVHRSLNENTKYSQLTDDEKFALAKELLSQPASNEPIQSFVYYNKNIVLPRPGDIIFITFSDNSPHYLLILNVTTGPGKKDTIYYGINLSQKGFDDGTYDPEFIQTRSDFEIVENAIIYKIYPKQKKQYISLDATEF